MPEIGSKSNRMPRDAVEMQQQLNRQLTYLRRSCEIFDRGLHDEAPRIATSLRVLLHDGPNSHSLLGQLGLKGLRFINTGVYRDELETAWKELLSREHPDMVKASRSPMEVGLVELATTPEGLMGWVPTLRLRRYVPGSPPAIATPGEMDFDEWWTRPLVETSSGRSFSREHLVKIMANQDGGAHVDPSLDKDYAELQVDTLGMQGQVIVGEAPNVQFSDLPAAQNNVSFASVRQIAFELQASLARHAGEDFPEAPPPQATGLVGAVLIGKVSGA